MWECVGIIVNLDYDGCIDSGHKAWIDVGSSGSMHLLKTANWDYFNECVYILLHH